MKHSFTIQRLCLFLLVLVLAAPAWATDYGNYGYEIFRSRETVEKIGKNNLILQPLEQGHVKIRFGSCQTTSGTGSGAIYELARGSNIYIEADDGYSIRWIILRDTEGGEDYDHPRGIERISGVTSGYSRYFERNAISNSKISGGNKNDLNDDNNNIVVYNYNAPAKRVTIYTHNKRDWDRFKVRDIIVGYVRVPNVRFGKERYDVYYKRLPNFKPDCNFDGHDGEVWYKVDNNDIATADNGGELTFKRPGTVALTATCNANKNYAKVECSTTVNMMRDRVTFTAEGLPDVIFSNDSYNLREYLKRKAQSGRDFDQFNSGFSVTSSNPAVLRYDKPYLKFDGTAGEATITLKQEQNNYYEATTFSHTIIVARRDQYGTILIKDANEWKVFCKLVNEKGMTNLNARLEADVNLGEDIMMLGEGNSYRGTFDGQGHTLKFNWNVGSKIGMAPIKSVTDATIKNLHTEGQITSSTYALSGLVYSVYGTTAISGCVSNVNLTSSYSGSTCDAAGMAVYIHKDARITFDDCVVMGTFNGTESGRAGMSGFVGTFQKGTCILNNCLYLGESNAKSNSSSYTFAPGNATLTNCYYLNLCGDKQGTQVTKEQLKSGEVTYLLQNKRPENIWGQLLGTNDEPQLTADDAKKVCKVDFTYKGQLKATRYATKGKAIFGDMPTVTPQFLLGSDYNFHHYYRYGFSEYFTASTPVNADRTVGLFIEDRDYYEIASKDDWRRFCDLVRDGQNGIDAKMTADVDLGSDIWQVGNHYAGTFDGQGHTLKINWNNTSGWLAPFRRVDGATIKNLRTEGEIKSSSNILSGLVHEAYGTTTISGCISAVNITSTYDNGGCDAAGMIECVRDNANVTITDCLVKGKFHATTEKGRRYMGGFVNNQYGKCALISCLYLGENNATGGNTFASTSASGTTLTNCYYLNACGKPQGEQATEKQLKSGYVTNKLQADRTDQCHWAQTLGERPDLYNPTNKGKMNYVYHDGTKWACGDFYFKDDNPLPIGLDFTAAYVIYQRSFSFAGMSGTICLPYELPVQRFRAYTLSGGQGNKLYFKEVTGTLEAYKPYYITGLGVNPTPSGTNLQVKAFHDDNLTTATTTGHSMTGTVEGVDNATAAAANAYILQDDGDFHKVTTEHSGATVPAYRAYVVCPKSLGAKTLSIILDDKTTGIDGVTKDASGTDGPVYDLQGRRVADRLDDAARHRLPAGVYIVGGRKVILK